MKSLILKNKDQSWESCKSISANLLSAYQAIPHHKIEISFLETSALDLAESIANTDADYLILQDQDPKALLAFHYLSKKQLSRFKKIMVHLYGDFTLHTPFWETLANKLTGLPIEFIAASPRYKHFMEKFIQNNVYAGFFPVGEEYTFRESQKSQLSEQFALDEKSFWILYTGRISAQKNVIRLAKEVLLFQRQSKLNVQLLILGCDDDIGAPFFGKMNRIGEQSLMWAKFLDQLLPQEKKVIRYLGNQQGKDIQSFYNSADLFMSLSTHHDEDFGMSPAEALCSGLPGILSAWGGYSGFAHQEDYCRLIPIHFENKLGLKINSQLVQTALSQSVRFMKPSMRRELSKSYQKKFSVASAANFLNQRLKEKSKPFSGFTAILSTHSNKFKAGRGTVFPNWPQDDFYPKVYHPYFENEHNL